MKPVLLWPKPQSAISAALDRSPDDFTVVDTGSRYELRRLSGLQSDTPILDPFPGHGEHYREFHSHIAASGCRYVISGLQPCRDVLRLGLCDGPQQVADDALRPSGPLSRLRRAAVDPGPAPGTETLWKTAAQGASIGNFIQPALSLLTPAIGELLLFFGTLFFFLIGGAGLRTYLVLLSRNRDARLRTLRILDDIEHNLTRYMGTVSIVNMGVGLITAIGVHLMGFPNPVLWGALAFVFNYVPYIGPAVMVFVLFSVGLVIFSSLGYALIAPIFFVALTTIEGHFVTPNIIGRNLNLSPLIVFLALVFCTRLWGP